MASSYLLVSHGSRDPRPQQAMEALAALIRTRLQTQLGLGSSSEAIAAPADWVGTACLELGPCPLHEQIQQFAQRSLELGRQHIQILPLFLLAGVHVAEDIPAEVAIAQQKCQADLNSDITLDLRPVLGSHPGLPHLWMAQMAPVPVDQWIVLSHGSRRQTAHRPVEAMAEQLGAIAAYWSVAPDLASQVQVLAERGCHRIGILPYFLFAGGITDAIAQRVADLEQQFPQLELHLAQPLGASPALVDLIMALMAD